MNVNLMPFSIAGVVLVLSVIALAVWRKAVAKQEDDTLHVLADSSVTARQVSVAHRLDVLDKWGQILTVVAAAYALVMVVLHVYQHWVRNSTPQL